MGTTTLITLAAWFVGLLLDANLDMGSGYEGFLCLRVLFPMLAMGLCILHAIKRGSK